MSPALRGLPPRRRVRQLSRIALLLLLPAALAGAGGLEDELGRSESRVRSAPFPLRPGRSVWDYGLEQRLERLGYERARRRPAAPGQYFWGHEVFWIFRRAHRLGGENHPAALVGLELGAGGEITGIRSLDGEAVPPGWLPSGPWQPVNSDGRFRGVVDVRAALRDSLNVPFVRVARWCGLEPTARRMRRAGLEIPSNPPPAFALGAIETTPLELARAYTVFATLGKALTPRAVHRLKRPGGRRLHRFKPRGRRIASPEAAFLIRDLMLDAVREGTASGAAIEDLEVAAKTGTTSDRRDAWLAGHAEGLVTVAWIGRDDAKPLGLTGAQAAAPLWRRFMERAVKARPPRLVTRPEGVVTLWVSSKTGLRPPLEPPRPLRPLPPRRLAPPGPFLARR